MLLLLFLSFVLPSVSEVQAVTCKLMTKSIDLRHNFGPIRDQDSIGWCYAFAGADILGFELSKKYPYLDTTKKEQQISAVALGIAHNTPLRSMRFRRFKRKMQRYKQLQEDKYLYQKTEQKLIALLNNQKKREDEIIQKRVDLKDRYQKYCRLISKCEQRGMYRLCDEFWKDENRDVTALQDFFLDDPVLLKLDREKDKLFDLLEELADAKQKPTFVEKDGGHTGEAIKETLEYGICLESEIPSDDYQLSKQMQKVLSEPDLRKLEEYIDKKQFLGKGIKLLSRVSSEEYLEHCQAAQYLQPLFPQLPLIDIYNILKEGFSKGNDPFISLYRHSCTAFYLDPKKKISILHSRNSVFGDATSEQLFAEIDQTLDKGNPVEFDYQAAILEYGGDLLDEELLRMDSGHASVIVGKQFNCNTGEVEYIIRNSWGYDSCEYDLRHFKTTPIVKKIKQVIADKKSCYKKCKKSERCLTRCYDIFAQARDGLFRWSKTEVPYRCDDGYYILPKKVLAKGLSGVTHF